MVLLLLGLVILALGYWLQARGRSAEKRLGVPVRLIKSADVGVEVPLKDTSVPKVLNSKRYKVAGKLDYVVEDTLSPGSHMPIEKKSARVWREPRDSDVFQVLASCFLLEENGYTVKRGRLVYDNRKFEISYGPMERQKVLQVLAEMRQAEKLSWLDMPMKQDRRCNGCVYRKLCA